MYGSIVTREHSKDVLDAIKGNEIWFEKVGSFSSEAFLQLCQSAAAVNLQVLLLDMDCTDSASLVKGLRIFRSARRETRIILIAPGRQPGDATITALLPLQIYDIVAPELSPDDPVDEDEGGYTEEDPDEFSYLTLLLKQQLAMESNYGNIARWDVFVDKIASLPVETKEKDKKEKERKQKERPPVTDPLIVEHIHSIQIEPPPAREKVTLLETIKGTVLVAVGGVDRRTGSTYAGLQLAKYLSDMGQSVALVELLHYSQPALGSLKPERTGENRFILEGIHCYPSADQEILLETFMSQYSYIVIDFGQVINLRGKEDDFFTKYLNEFVRADLHVLTMGASEWDCDTALLCMDKLFQINWNRPLQFLVNFATQQSFKNISTLFNAKERKQLQMAFHHNELQSNPMDLDEALCETILTPVLPAKKSKFSFFKKGR